MADENPYCPTQSIIIGSGATLTIEPGVQVRFPAGQLFGLGVGSGSFGAGMLIARGTADAPILFTSDAPDPQPGDWVGLNFTSQAVDAELDEDGNWIAGSILQYVVVEYAGGGGTDGTVNINDSRPYLTHCTVRNNASTGIFVRNVGDNEPPIRIENCIINANSADQIGGGIWLATCPSAALIGNSIISNRVRGDVFGGGGVALFDSPSSALIGNIIRGNNARRNGGGIYVVNSAFLTLTGDTILRNFARFRGGALYVRGRQGVTVSDSVIVGNISGDGAVGGIFGELTESLSLNPSGKPPVTMLRHSNKTPGLGSSR